MHLVPPSDPPGAVWFAKLQLIVSASVMSGTTANRPTQGLFVGRTYFDTDLTHPIWVQSLGPTVWADATGASV